MTSFDDLQKELAELEEANAKAPHWGAAVGVRHERIKAIQAILNPKVKSKTFIVGHIDWMENELRLEKVTADSWQDAVSLHTKFPWTAQELAEDEALRGEVFFSGETTEERQKNFKRQCFDCDCMMSWIEVS